MKTIVEPSADIASMLSGSMPEHDIVNCFRSMEHVRMTPAILADAAKAVRRVCLPVELHPDAIDTCGTGGSGKKTINTSTLSAFIVAAAGGKVAKHGNRSASGNCGCFDLLEGIGAKIDLTVDDEKRIFDHLGIVFLFARTHHPALKHVAAARTIFGKPTVFNLVGPLANPAHVTHQMIGTPDRKRAELMAGALHMLGTESSLVVTGSDGLDEVTVCGTTEILRVPGNVHSTFSPQELGIGIEEEASIAGGTVAQNLAIFRSLATGEGSPAHRNLVLLNAAFALTLTDLAGNVHEGFALAKETLDSGRVSTLIDQYVHLTHS